MLPRPTSSHLVTSFTSEISSPGRLNKNGASREVTWPLQIPLLTKARSEDKVISQVSRAESILPEFRTANGCMWRWLNSNIEPAVVTHSPLISTDLHELILLSLVRCKPLSATIFTADTSVKLPEMLIFWASISNKVNESNFPLVNPFSETVPFSSVTIFSLLRIFILPDSVFSCSKDFLTLTSTEPTHSKLPVNDIISSTMMVDGFSLVAGWVHLSLPGIWSEFAVTSTHSISHWMTARWQSKEAWEHLRGLIVSNTISSTDSSTLISWMIVILFGPSMERRSFMGIFAAAHQRRLAWRQSSTESTDLFNSLLTISSLPWNSTKNCPRSHSLRNLKHLHSLKIHSGSMVPSDLAMAESISNRPLTHLTSNWSGRTNPSLHSSFPPNAEKDRALCDCELTMKYLST